LSASEEGFFRGGCSGSDNLRRGRLPNL